MPDSPNRTAVLAAGALALAGAGLVAAIVLAPDPAEEVVENTNGAQTSAEPTETGPLESNADRFSIRAIQDGLNPRDDKEPPAEGLVRIPVQGGGTVDVPADSPAAKAHEAREAASKLESEALNATGPQTNPGVGPESWGAPISKEEEAEIQAAFDALPEPDPRVTRRDRKTSIEVARVVIDDCFRDLQRRHPGRKGRIAVAWTASADQGSGVISDPEITLNLKLREVQFESCVVDGLDGLTFPAADQGEPLRVEYPFLYDT